MPAFVLIHAPLAGPSTWSLVAEELRSRGMIAVVPSLTGVADGGPPYWPRYGAAAAQALIELPDGTPVVLAAHSGAGFFLPLVRQAIRQPVQRYVFVDAVVPEGGMSRIPRATSRGSQWMA